MIEIQGPYIIIWSIFTYFLGLKINSSVKSIQRFSIPEGVLGGIPVCIMFFLIRYIYDVQIVFDTNLRDFFLLFFFCTIGMLADTAELRKGGSKLIKLVFLLFLFLILQNTVGLLVSYLMNIPLVNGLIVGSVTLAGGHGTAISWGQYFEALGHEGAIETGMIAATLGLIAGGMLGGPVATKLIKKHNLLQNKKKKICPSSAMTPKQEFVKFISSTNLFLVMIFCIMVALVAGLQLNQLIRNLGIFMPDYVPAIFTGIVLVNINKVSGNKIKLNKQKLQLLNGISLQVFITMSMITIELEHVINRKVIDILFILACQIVLMLVFAKYLFFRAAGSNYHSAVLTGGFVGSGMGATPVGIANVSSITRKYYPSTEAFLLLPLLGSIFTDILNALVLQFFVTFI